MNTTPISHQTQHILNGPFFDSGFTKLALKLLGVVRRVKWMVSDEDWIILKIGVWDLDVLLEWVGT